MACFGSPWVCLGWEWFRMDPKLYTNLLDPIWTPFGSLMDQFWFIFGLLDYCWVTAGWSLLLPYSCKLSSVYCSILNCPPTCWYIRSRKLIAFVRFSCLATCLCFLQLETRSLSTACKAADCHGTGALSIAHPLVSLSFVTHSKPRQN